MTSTGRSAPSATQTTGRGRSSRHPALAAARAARERASAAPDAKTAAHEPPNARLIGATEAAILGVNRATVINWAGRGAFPAVRYRADGKTTLWRFARADIEAFVERSRVRPQNGAQDPRSCGT